MNRPLHTRPVAVVAAGAVTCVGLSAASTCAAVRASLDGFQETQFVDQVGQALLGARLDDVAIGLRPDEPADAESPDAGAPDWIHGGAEKWAAMAVHAARECAINAGGLSASDTVLLLVGPDAQRASYGAQTLPACAEAVQRAIGHRFHPQSISYEADSPGLALALQRGCELLALDDVEAVLVVCVDSLLNAADVNQHLAQGRLLTSEHSDGFIPGEAAAALLLRRIDAAPAARAAAPAVHLKIGGLGLSYEPDHWASGEPNYGKGLAQALRQALAQAGLQAHEIHHRLSTGTGESFFSDEETYAWSRVLRQRSPAGYSEPLVAASVGHCGSAQAALAVVLALDMARKGWAAGTNFLLHAAHAHAARCAVVLQAVHAT